MNAKRTFDEIEDAGATLAQLRELASQFESKYSFVSRITSPQDYSRATAMLDELTGGRELGPNEEALLDELTSAITDYENNSEQFSDFNSRWEKKLTPIELLKALMESSDLKGNDLPEIGDKTVVSKVLSGRRKISHKMAMALGQRFSMAPEAFLDDATYDVQHAFDEEKFVNTLYLEDWSKDSGLDKTTFYAILDAVSDRIEKHRDDLERHWEFVHKAGGVWFASNKSSPSIRITQSHFIHRKPVTEGTYITVFKNGDKQIIAPFKLLKTS